MRDEITVEGTTYEVEYSFNENGLDELFSIKTKGDISEFLPASVLAGIARGLIEIQGEK